MRCSFLVVIFIRLFNFSFCWGFWDSTKDYLLGERCSDNWLLNDIPGLQLDLRHKVFGQPFIEGALLPLLKKHVSSDSNPRKALALSFHGGPGLGKTYVSQIIAGRLFKEGARSRFYKFISMSQSWFISQSSIRSLITETVMECERSMFVFDEIEKMPDGVIEVLKSFLDFHPHVGQVDYRKSIFIFISNIGMDHINSLSFNLWKRGYNREDFYVGDFEKVLFEPTYNEKGGLKKTSIVKNFLIDLYLPFLPLEKDHVIKCIQTEAKNMGYTLKEDSMKNILESLTFLPPGEALYSSSGCKTIASLIFRYGYGHDEL